MNEDREQQVPDQVRDDNQNSTNDASASAAKQSPTDDFQTQIEELKAKLAQQAELTLIARADLENYRKRMEGERAKFGVMANMLIVQQLLEVMEDLQLARNDESMDLKRAQEMLGIVNDKLTSTLASAGVETIQINKGDKFDPNIAEAITSIPTDSEELNNTVADVVSLPVRFKADGSLLKTGKVVVHKFKN